MPKPKDAPSTTTLSMPMKYLDGLNPHLATTAPPMATFASPNAANPFRSVSPRQPQTMPATMARNWKTTPLTLALLATFSGSMTMSFLPAERTLAIGWYEGGQRRVRDEGISRGA